MAVDWPNTLLNSATLIAALGAVYFSHRSLQIQRKQKLAEFRKEWIENLRTHLAEFTAATYRRATAKQRLEVYSNKSKNIQLAREWREKYMQFTEEVARHNSYIILCLNGKEPEHEELIKKMQQYVDEQYELVKQKPRIHELARAVLKKEWERLKTDV